LLIACFCLLNSATKINFHVLILSSLVLIFKPISNSFSPLDGSRTRMWYSSLLQHSLHWVLGMFFFATFFFWDFYFRSLRHVTEMLDATKYVPATKITEFDQTQLNPFVWLYSNLHPGIFFLFKMKVSEDPSEPQIMWSQKQKSVANSKPYVLLNWINTLIYLKSRYLLYSRVFSLNHFEYREDPRNDVNGFSKQMHSKTWKKNESNASKCHIKFESLVITRSRNLWPCSAQV